MSKLWDRDGDGRITKPEFRDKVSTLLSCKLKFQDIKESFPDMLIQDDSLNDGKPTRVCDLKHISKLQ